MLDQIPKILKVSRILIQIFKFSPRGFSFCLAPLSAAAHLFEKGTPRRNMEQIQKQKGKTNKANKERV